MRPLILSLAKAKAKRQETSATLVDAWSLTPDQLLAALHSTDNGIQQIEAERRLKQYGLNALYVLVTEIAKRYFYSRLKNATA